MNLQPVQFSGDEALAAMCLWEAVCVDRNTTGGPWEQDRENEGTCALRDAVLGMAALCEADWEAAHPEQFDAPFDWEFAPKWLAHNYEALRDGERRRPALDRAARLAWIAGADL